MQYIFLNLCSFNFKFWRYPCQPSQSLIGIARGQVTTMGNRSLPSKKTSKKSLSVAVRSPLAPVLDSSKSFFALSPLIFFFSKIISSPKRNSQQPHPLLHEIKNPHSYLNTDTPFLLHHTFNKNWTSDASLQCVAATASGGGDEERERLLPHRAQLRQELLQTRWSWFRLLHSQMDFRPRTVSLPPPLSINFFNNDWVFSFIWF